MPFSIKGYVLEPPRLGSANSPFTSSPNNIVADSVAFSAAYPSGSEPNPRVDYHVFVWSEGNLTDATFSWTKNEGITGATPIAFNRFDYDGKAQRFKTLPGSNYEVSGTLTTDSNTSRLKVTKPPISNFTSFPLRVAIATGGSGTTFTTIPVVNDGAFTSPPAGTVEVSLDTGNLNWNTSDLTLYAGNAVWFQRQTFFSFRDATGKMGDLNSVLLLNPKPITTQNPLLRIGYSNYLTVSEVATEAGFNPSLPSGQAEWALDTGRINLSPSDILSGAGNQLYYDGVTYANDLALPTQTLGIIPSGYSSLAIPSLPAAGGDLIFHVPGIVQFPQVQIVTAFTDSVGQAGVVQVLYTGMTGQVRFSLADRSLYAGMQVKMTSGNLDIERGIALRLFRNPVNLAATDPTLKDVTAFYTTTDAIIASPLIGAPQVFLPAIPTATAPITVKVTQGTGTFTGILPRLDVPTPPSGLGYALLEDSGQLEFRQRKENVVVTLDRTTGSIVLPDPLLDPANTVFEIETSPGSGTYTPLVLGLDALLEPLSGQLSFTKTTGEIVWSSGSGNTSSNILTDSNASFISAGITPGYYVLIRTGNDAGIYRVVDVLSETSIQLDSDLSGSVNCSYEIRPTVEILGDRFFAPLVLADPVTKVERVRYYNQASNSPRQTIPTNWFGKLRLRYGAAPSTTFATISVVATDANFQNPNLLDSGIVEISQASGHVNYPTSKLGENVYSVVQQEQGVDYTINPNLGFIGFTTRALEKDEGYVTYVDPSGNLITDEPIGWIVRKESAQPRTIVTNTVQFNPRNRTLTDPAPTVFRGGRPQQIGIQCNVTNGPPSTITFLPDNQITTTWPHGDNVSPTEKISVDYYIREALGGEKSATVLAQALQLAVVSMADGLGYFEILGNWLHVFKDNYLLKIERLEIHLIGSSVYTPSTNTTRVNLLGLDVFKDSYTNPTIEISSGPTPYYAPSYFVQETATFDPIPRGSNKLYLEGDLTTTYQKGVVVAFTDSSNSFLDFQDITGASYNPTTNRTEVVLSGNLLKQVVQGAQIIRRTVRPVFSDAPKELRTSKLPATNTSRVVYRRVEGSPGILLQEPQTVQINDSGNVSLKTPLQANEEAGIFYTGYVLREEGVRVRSSYTATIAPTTSNGLLGQGLTMDYTTYSPDTWYWRVETLTNFRKEYADEIEQKAASGTSTGGPTLANASQPDLFEQGKASLYFNEGHLANQDIAARASLFFYNNVINYLEDYLQGIDGRVVGHHDGRFKFDGLIDNPPVANFLLATNQIDDRFKISDAPYITTFVGPGFTTVSLGTYQEIWKPAATSRFYPMFKRAFGATGAAAETGEPILDTGVLNIQTINDVHTRPAWALITQDAKTGDTDLIVDNAAGSADLVRPPFLLAMECVIQQPDGTLLVTSGSPVTVTAVTPTQLSISALPVDIPKGCTIYRSPSDPSNTSGAVQPGITDNLTYTSYGFDVNGQLTWVKASFPLDGTLSPFPVPDELVTKQIPAGTALSINVYYNNTRTEPYRAPVFDGLTYDDDGGRYLPLLTPSFMSEKISSLEVPPDGGGLDLDEYNAIVAAPPGTIRSVTTDPFEGTGSLDVTKTIITNSGAFPAPVPQLYDLVRIVSGANGQTDWRRITNVTPTTITVDTPFSVQDSGFSFVVTVSTGLVTGGATFAGTVVTDAFANFQTAGVLPGHTLVVTSGAFIGERRQVLSVDSATQLTLSIAIGAGAGNYRVTDSLSTFGGVPDSLYSSLVTTLQNNLIVVGTSTTPLAEIPALEGMFNEVFTDVIPAGTGSASGTTLTDGSATFLTSGVSTSHLIYIRSGVAQGIYQISSVDSETSITVTPAFPSADPSASYRVVSYFGVGLERLLDLFEQLKEADLWYAQIQSFQTLVTTTVDVLIPGPVIDPNMFGLAWLPSDLASRETELTTRMALIDDPAIGPVAVVTNVVKGADKLYDVRFVWVSARINYTDGLLVSKERAVQNRITTQAKVVSELTKLLAVQGAS